MPAPIDEARLRELLAREQDVDVDATIAGLRSSSEPPAEPGDPAPQPNPAPQPGDPAPQPAPQPGSPQPAPQPAPEQSAAAAGVVQLTAGQYEAMSADAAFAGQMRREQTLDRYADRYTPAERASFAEALERDEAGTTALLAKLSPKFSTTPRGADNAPNVDAGNAPDDAAWAAWEAQTFGAGLEDARRPAQ